MLDGLPCKWPGHGTSTGFLGQRKQKTESEEFARLGIMTPSHLHRLVLERIVWSLIQAIKALLSLCEKIQKAQSRDRSQDLPLGVLAWTIPPNLYRPLSADLLDQDFTVFLCLVERCKNKVGR